MTIRAFFEAVKIESAQPPYDTLHLKIFYPAEFKQSEAEKISELSLRIRLKHPSQW